MPCDRKRPCWEAACRYMAPARAAIFFEVHWLHAPVAASMQKVQRFVAGQGSSMDYTVAVDAQGAVQGARSTERGMLQMC